ncbi:condensation domain-containing protein, partial [uncultured Aquimarina sp.]|uniref:condensation domain-containing protein n=1 Tax=uncultured Aquimarina sp. TaxID=575652 RepID=UPI0026073918
AWKACISEYPILRTAFNWEEDIIQIIYKNGSLQYELHDISDLKTQELRDQRIIEIQQDDRAQGFDLTKPTLLRIHIIKQAPEYYTVLKSDHHSISDGWSVPILLDRLHKHYQTFIDHKTVRFQQDHAYLQTQAYINSHKETIAQYWKDKLTDIQFANDINPLLSTPIDLHSYKGVIQPEFVSLEITGKRYDALRSFTRQHGLTINTIVQFVWHKLLQVYSSS